MDQRQTNHRDDGQQVGENEQPATGAPDRRKASWKSLLGLKTLMSMDVDAEAAKSEEQESVSSRLDDCLRSGWAGALTPGGIRSPFDS